MTVAALPERTQELAAAATFPLWQADLRSRALAALTATRFPDRKSERWKYTRLTALAESGALERAAPLADAALPDLPAIDAWRLVFVNGRFDAAQSRLPDDGSIVASSLVALAADEQPTARELVALTDTGTLPFAAFNAAAWSDGLYLRVARGHQATRPVHVIFHATANQPATTQGLLLVRLDEQAALTLIEQHTGAGESVYANTATVLDLAAGARLDWLRLQFDDHRQFSTGSVHLRQARDSQCRGWLFMSGSRLKRNDLRCVLAGSGAQLDLHGVFLAGAGEHVDNQIAIEHAAPHATSNQLFKGLAGGDGRAVFNGRIHIHPGARQTSAELVNNNLLLSKEAEIDSKPELEIWNDDVKCAHGATVGQLNAGALFYLQSRGIDRAAAELMLGLGFVNALVDTVPLPALADWLRDGFARWFAGRGSRP